MANFACLISGTNIGCVAKTGGGLDNGAFVPTVSRPTHPVHELSDCSPPSVVKVNCSADYGVGHSVTINFCAAGGAHSVANATTVEEDTTISIAKGVGGFYNIWQTISSDASGTVKCNEDLPQYAAC